MIPFVDGDPIDCDVAIRNWPGHPDCDIAEASYFDGLTWTLIYRRFVSPLLLSAVVTIDNLLVLTFDGDITSVDPNAGISVRLPFRTPIWNTIYNITAGQIQSNEIDGYTVTLGVGVIAGATITYPLTGVFSGDTVLVSYSGITGLLRGTSGNPRDKIGGFTDYSATNQVATAWDPNILFAGGVWGDSFDLLDTQFVRKANYGGGAWVDAGAPNADNDRIGLIKSRLNFFTLTPGQNYNGGGITDVYKPRWSTTEGVLFDFGAQMRMAISDTAKLRNSKLAYTQVSSLKHIAGDLTQQSSWAAQCGGFCINGTDAQAYFTNGSSIASNAGGALHMKIRKGQGGGEGNAQQFTWGNTFGDPGSSTIVGVKFIGDPNGWGFGQPLVEEPVPDVYTQGVGGGVVTKFTYGTKAQNGSSNSINEANLNLFLYCTRVVTNDTDIQSLPLKPPGTGFWWHPLPNPAKTVAPKRTVIIGADLSLSDFIRCFDWCNV